MNSLFPELTAKIHRLEAIKNNPDDWEEIEALNKELIEIDGFKKHILQ
jgi:hypothetical protein